MRVSSRQSASVLFTVVTSICVSLTACGTTKNDTGSSVRANTVDSSEALRPSPSITGDYDGDDDYAKQGRSDGDNDDSHRPKDRDSDSDSRGKNAFDGDDRSVRSFGHAAGVVDRRTIEGLVKRYYVAAAMEDGATACSMIVSSLANSVPETLGGPAGQLYARGKTCAAVMSGLFAHYHRQLSADAAAFEVGAVRIKRNEGVVALAFNLLPTRRVRVARKNGVWEMDSLLDIELP